MRKIILLLSFLSFSFITNIVDAVSVPAIWTYNWSAWKVVFPSTNWVFINTDAFVLNNSANMGISWNFWIQNISSSSNVNYWWATFDIWTVTWAPKVTLINNLDNTFTFNWYAWSNAAWWIYFSPTLLKDDSNNNITNSKVIYNRWYDDWKWRLEWCAVSQNMWLICFDWITLDTTPPHIFNTGSISTVSWADYNKTIKLNEECTVIIQRWDNTSSSTYNVDAPLFVFSHDMRNASNQYRDYNIKAIDVFWNTTTWSIKIVANIPDTILNSYNIWWAWVQASTYNWTLWLDKIADWKDTHVIDIKLRDTYWNPIVTVPWIKNVEVTLGFTNNLDKVQIWTEENYWDAINFSSTDFIPALFWYPIEEANASTDVDWNYKIYITSLAPSKEWYTYTTNNNDIRVSKLDINITALNWNSWFWEGYYDKKDYYLNNYKFTPAIKVDWVLNSNSWVIYRDYPTIFTITWTTNKTSWSSDLTDIHITHLFDIMSWSIYKNNQINFQGLSWTISNTTCLWNKTSTWYYYTDTLCNRSTLLPYSSNIIRAYPDITTNNTNLIDLLSTTPRVITAWLTSFDTKYSSIVYYKIGGIDIKYNSYTTSSSTINNSQIKIAWIVNNNKNNFSVVDNSSINYIWNVSKLDVYTLINKNVSIFRNAWTWSVWTLYMTWNYTLTTWPSWINTVIIDWWDIVIWGDISKTPWTIKTIIALKKSDWTKWNIWIKNNVQFIWASLITNRSILSWDWINYYADTNSAPDQLFIKWNALSYNSIWWSSNTVFTCPYYITTTCDLLMARRYDFNHIRSYINWVRWNGVNWTTYWVNMSLKWYTNAPMIIEYDSDIQKNTPSILKK